jgi:hypothetical protein
MFVSLQFSNNVDSFEIFMSNSNVNQIDFNKLKRNFYLSTSNNSNLILYRLSRSSLHSPSRVGLPFTSRPASKVE